MATTTVQHLATAAVPADWGPAWFCATPSCAVVYFRADGDHLDRPDLVVPVFQKETDGRRPVCYCFGHSVADILDAQRDDGSNRLVEEITSACRRGLDRCEETNPQGRCCLGNVRGLLRIASPSTCCPE